MSGHQISGQTRKLLPAARISTSWPGSGQEAPGGSSGHPLEAPGASSSEPPPARCLCCPVSLPAITDAGQLVGRAGTSRLATYTTGAGHLYHQGLATYQGPGSGYPGAVSQFHHAAFQLTCPEKRVLTSSTTFLLQRSSIHRHISKLHSTPVPVLLARPSENAKNHRKCKRSPKITDRKCRISPKMLKIT